MSAQPSGEAPRRQAFLKKSEILRQKRAIQLLFETGRSVQVPYLRLFFHVVPPCSSAKAMVLFSVSKRTFKRATARNRIKRLLREAYRLQKWTLHEALAQKLKPDEQLHLALLYQPQRKPLTLERALSSVALAFAKVLEQL
ncbi:MAG: ribonuclease P protein component [Candidatus Thermochlorobacter sp.]